MTAELLLALIFSTDDKVKDSVFQLQGEAGCALGGNLWLAKGWIRCSLKKLASWLNLGWRTHQATHILWPWTDSIFIWLGIRWISFPLRLSLDSQHFSLWRQETLCWYMGGTPWLWLMCLLLMTAKDGPVFWDASFVSGWLCTVMVLYNLVSLFINLEEPFMTLLCSSFSVFSFLNLILSLTLFSKTRRALVTCILCWP